MNTVNSVTSKEAMRLLNIRRQTLYAYVSRGIIRRFARPGTSTNLYSMEDIYALIARKAAHRGHAAVAADAMHWGSPIFSSTVTQIDERGPHYRGHYFRDLIAHPGHFECVAELLWNGMLLDEPVTWKYAPLPKACEQVVNSFLNASDQPTILRLMAATTLALGESSSDELRAGNTVELAKRLMFSYIGAIGTLGPRRQFFIPPPDTSVASAILQALGCEPTPATVSAINALLITAADHELSPPTFSARVCASSSAGLHACIIAAISGHSGYHLGRGCDRIEALLESFSDEDEMKKTLRQKLLGGLKIPGFNLVLYPGGDPRARVLLDVASRFSVGPKLATTLTLVELAQNESGQQPNIEIGLVALAYALGLPRHSAVALWALGRTAGWVAHVIEQRLSGMPIRPRAQFALRGAVARDLGLSASHV